MLVRNDQVKPLFVLSLLANVGLALGAGYLILQPKAGESPERRTGTGEGSDKEVNALGRIQPSVGLISVYGVPGDQIGSINVKVGDLVIPRQKLGELTGEKSRGLSLVTLRKQIEEAEKLRKAIGRQRSQGMG